jgi:hypothetical protein
MIGQCLRMLPSALRCFALATLPALTACGNTDYTYRYDSPDHGVTVVVDPKGNRRAADGTPNDIFLLGAAPAQAPDATGFPKGEKIRIGGFVGDWSPSSIAWTDATTVNICPLKSDPAALSQASILVSERSRRTYHFTFECPASRAR